MTFFDDTFFGGVQQTILMDMLSKISEILSTTLNTGLLTFKGSSFLYGLLKCMKINGFPKTYEMTP